MAQRRADGPRYFPETQWSLVGRAGRRAGAEALAADREAMRELLKRYMPALHSYLVYRKRFDTNEADDLLQGFLLSKIVEQDLIAEACPERGKFRNYLLISLNRFVISEIRRERAKKRGGGDKTALDENTDVPQQEASDEFDVEWARQLLAQAIEKMHDECHATNRMDVWGIFEARVLNPALHGAPPMEYDQLVETFKLISPAQASNLLVTGRRTFVRVLRNLIAEYEPDDRLIDAELNDLQNILSRATPSAESEVK
jgi:RNA polymerase sigma-70 factor (ECF subfamily)